MKPLEINIRDTGRASFPLDIIVKAKLRELDYKNTSLTYEEAVQLGLALFKAGSEGLLRNKG